MKMLCRIAEVRFWPFTDFVVSEIGVRLYSASGHLLPFKTLPHQRPLWVDLGTNRPEYPLFR
jgi:hypothetical protein